MLLRRSESIAALSDALAKAQGKFKVAEKNAVNPFLKNRYADLGSIIEASRGALTENGLSVMQVPTLESGNLTITTLLAHASGEWVESDLSLGIDQDKGLSNAQSMGKTITYLRRYALSAMLGIYAGDDEDGGDDTKQAAKPKAQPAPKAEPAPQPTQPKPADGSHWIDDPKVRAAFWAHWNSKTLSQGDVHKALGVESVKDYTGTKEEAFTAINAYIEAKAQA